MRSKNFQKNKTTRSGKPVAGKPQRLPAVKKAVSKKPTAKKTIREKKAKGIRPFPIVGIGGSAGGLEAFSEFLNHLNPDLGMAYVYIQHLSSQHESFLPEIIQRKTSMPVLKIRDKMPLEKNKLYISPPKYNIALTDGKFKLQPQRKEEMLHSIDYFLSSLSVIYQQNAIGIILSGTGTDGTLGLMSIKTEGGITFAQDDSAHYIGMPQNAAESGYVDFVLPPDKIASELATLIRHPYAVSTPNEILLDNKNHLRKIDMIMHNKKGVDFSHYKRTTINRRIMRRMALNKIKDLEDYAKLLKENKLEADALYQDLLITVTNFFRDANMYQALSTKLLPLLLKNRRPGDPLRVWIPGCATGEEAVSFAIVVLEYLGEKAITTPVQIFATDLNEKAIERARTGVYLKSAMQHVSPQRLKRFFVKTDGQYQVVKAIRDMCVFAPHNLLKDPPFSRMDIISCQNVLIYLESKPQNRIMHAFHYALKPHGYLLLGKSETIGTATDLFEQVNKQSKIYTKKIINAPLQLDFTVRRYPTEEMPVQEDVTQTPQPAKELDLEKETDKLLLSRYVPAAVLINKDLEILRFRGATSRFLEPSSGKASLNLLKMIREEIAFDLRTVIHRAKKDSRPTRKDGLIIDVNGDTQEISIEVVPVKGKGKESYYLIIFRELGRLESAVVEKEKSVSGSSKEFMNKRISSLEAQLRESKDAIRIITEDFESTREELQSANEEVLSSNEELQSINEELETSREELQSTNEELTTINEELQIRNAELKDAEEYSRAIIETMHESLIMLTGDLKIKNANKGFYQTFRLTPGETEGMYLYEIADHQWDLPELRKQLRMIQTRDLTFTDFEMEVDFPSTGKKYFLINIHKFPIRDRESLIMLAIQDLTSRKKMEESLRQNEERFRLLIQNASDIIMVFDQDGTVKYASPAIENLLGFKAEERIGRNVVMDPLIHPDDRDRKIELLRTSIAKPRENIYGEFRLRHKDGSYRTIDAIFRNLLDDPKISGVIANYRDITERKIFENQKDKFIGIASHELKTPVTSIKEYAQILEKKFLAADDKNSAGLVHKINTQLERLTGLITDLLDFTKLEGGVLKFREEEYYLNDLIHEVTDQIQLTTKKHQIIKKLGMEVQLSGDRYRTGQVIENLLNNAIKYSPKAKEVIISTHLDKDKVTIEIQDFGIGIDQKLQKKVFDRFFRITQSTRNTYPGLGLGLYIASEFVKKQGGKIWVKSKKDRGTSIFFSLPLKKQN